MARQRPAHQARLTRPAPAIDPSRLPESVYDCVVPLARAAMETSVLAHRWGTSAKGGSLIRAAHIMDLASRVVRECNALVTHAQSAQTTERATAVQREVGVSGGGGGAR